LRISSKLYVADVTSWYVRMQEAWFGRNWSKMKGLQPSGLRDIDRSSLNGKDVRSRGASRHRNATDFVMGELQRLTDKPLFAIEARLKPAEIRRIGVQRPQRTSAM
jgi:hypothetical protein